MRVKHDFHLWVHELLMTLKTWASEEVPRQAKIESYLPNGQGGIQLFLEPWWHCQEGVLAKVLHCGLYCMQE